MRLFVGACHLYLDGVSKIFLRFCNFVPENKKITLMNPTIDTYRLTSMEEPSDAVLSQLMKEAAEEAKRTNEEITTQILHHEWMENAIYINPEQIANDKFGDWNSHEAIMQSVKYCEALREECLREKKSLIF